MKEFFLVKVLLSFLHLHFEQNVPNLFVWKSRKVCETRFLRVQKINFLSENLKYPQTFMFSVLTAKNSLRELFGRVVKSALVLTTVTFSGKLFPWSFVFFCFWDFEWKSIRLRAKEAYQVVKKSLYVSRRSFFLLEKLQNAQMFSSLVLPAKTIFSKTFWQTFQKYTCIVHSNILMKTSSLKVCFLLGFWV